MTEVISIVIAALSALAAVGSYFSARASNSTAKRLAQIEADRRHEELIPMFEAVGRELSNGQIELSIKLVGPAALAKLDGLVVTIRDDTTDHTAGITGLIDAEIAAQVWSKYRLVPGVDGTDARGRASGPVSLLLGDDSRYLLEPTPAPHWSTPDAWKTMYRGKPLRITISGHRGDEAPWSVPVELTVHHHLRPF